MGRIQYESEPCFMPSSFSQTKTRNPCNNSTPSIQSPAFSLNQRLIWRFFAHSSSGSSVQFSLREIIFDQV
ncbi:hypothetical protein CUMW_106020 [Citrus unshiu]|nr:hypothetical protein CUMW_106020 [Citrus unshiu]GAY47652.1 hypothetical protein CUMW_106020 [Citrus unshiu]